MHKRVRLGLSALFFYPTGFVPSYIFKLFDIISELIFLNIALRSSKFATHFLKKWRVKVWLSHNKIPPKPGLTILCIWT